MHYPYANKSDGSIDTCCERQKSCDKKKHDYRVQREVPDIWSDIICMKLNLELYSKIEIVGKARYLTALLNRHVKINS